MKILVCLSKKEKAQKIFEHTVEAVKETKVRGEVFLTLQCESIKKKLSDNIYEYDIVMLDAFDQKCLEIARYIRDRNFIASILFISDHSQVRSDLFSYRPSELITESEDNKQITEAVMRACREQVRANPYFTIKTKEAVMRVNYADIFWFESRQRIVILHGRTKEITFYAKLSEVYDRVPKEIFLRCHQSYIVNGNMIRSIDKVHRCLDLVTGEVIEISKSYYKDVLSFAGQGRF